MSKFAPINDQVLIRPTKLEESQSPGGILITGTTGQPDVGEVVATGCGHLTAQGERVPLRVEPGQTVAYNRGNAVALRVDGVDHVVVSEHAILGYFG